jgi:pyrroline-5-carboxylate reductase
MDTNSTITVLGCGNIGLSIAKGIVYAKIAPANQVVVTKRNERLLVLFFLHTPSSSHKIYINTNFHKKKEKKNHINCKIILQ